MKNLIVTVGAVIFMVGMLSFQTRIIGAAHQSRVLEGAAGEACRAAALSLSEREENPEAAREEAEAVLVKTVPGSEITAFGIAEAAVTVEVRQGKIRSLAVFRIEPAEEKETEEAEAKEEETKAEGT